MAYPSRFLFANQLRGLAALLVLLSHWFGVYWGMREVVASHIAAPVQGGTSPLAYHLVSFNPDFGLGPFGVSIFFLISGFVIPFSLEKMPSLPFLVARIFRIFPTYWVGLIMSLAFVWCSSRYWGNPVPWNMPGVLANLFLCNDLTGIASIDLVNWTLAIEIKFYIVAALLSSAIRERKIAYLFLFSGLALLFNWNLKAIIAVAGNSSAATILESMGTAFVYIQFMLIGTFFYYAVLQKISTRSLLACCFFQLCIFALSWKLSPAGDQFPVVAWIYFYGFCLFALAFFLRHKFKTNKVIDLLAAVSFPLYVIHSLIGYTIIRYLMHVGMSFNTSAGMALICALTLAYLLHRLVELPTMATGKRLALALQKIKRLPGKDEAISGL
ncbi:MAG: acyltransferase [Pseudomonadota bacterium]